MYGITASGWIESAEGQQALATTEALWERGSFAVEGGISWEGRDGLRYAPGAPGLPVLALPLHALGLAIAPWLPPSLGEARFSSSCYPSELLVSALNPLLGALVAVLLFRLAEEMAFGRRASLWLALIYAFATVAWPDAKHAFPQPALTVCLLAAVREALRHRETGDLGRARRAGMALGAGMLVHVGALVALPALLLYVLLPHPMAGGRRRWRAHLPAAHMALGLGPATALLGVFNTFRFDSPFLMGYEAFGVSLAREAPLLFALHAHLFAAGSSILLYSPPLLLAALGFRDLWARRRAEAWLLVALALGFFLSFGRMNLWHGGWGWGVRYQSPWLPFALLAAGPRLQAGRRGLAQLLLAAGVAVQLLGIGVAYESHLGRSPNALHGKLYEDQAEVWFVPSHSPLPGHAELLGRYLGDLASRLRGVGRGDPLLYGRGFQRAERLEDRTTFRRAEPVAELHFAPAPAARRLELVVNDGWREGVVPCVVQVAIDGADVPVELAGAPAASSATLPRREWAALGIAIPPSPRTCVVTIRSSGQPHAAVALRDVALDGAPLDVDGRISWAGTGFAEKDALVHRSLDLWWIKVLYSDLPSWFLLAPLLLGGVAVAAGRALLR